MRPIIRASVLALGALLVGSADANAQIGRRANTPQNGVCFYEHSNFRGQYFCTDTNTQNPMIGMNDQISSIRVFGNAAVTVFQDREFLGRSQTFSSDITDLSQDGWNDTITSVRVRAAGRGIGSRFGRPAIPANGACFYENVNFTGDYFCSSRGETVEMVPQGTNDRISSIRLFGNAELVVYRDRDFSGPVQWFDASEADLREFGWNDTISSYRIETRGARGRGYGRGQGSGRGAGGYGRDTGYYEPTSGSLEWRGRVDDRVQLVIRGRSVQERIVSGAEVDTGRATFSSGLPAEPVRVNARMLAGRGNVRVIQQPSRQNGYTAIIEVNDPARGAQEQRLQVIWG